MHTYLKIPYALILFRFLCAPAMLLMAYYGGADFTGIIVLLLYLGLLSDILDGIFARNAGIADTKMRRLDSQTDMIFWVAAGWSAWALHPEVIREHSAVITLIFIMEGACYLISILRFGRETCCHAYLSKFWGLCLLAAFTALIGFGKGGFFFNLAIIFGLISHLDRIAITLIIPHWTHDIPSTWHAIQLRKGRAIKKYKLFN